jgi:hypothetical protein
MGMPVETKSSATDPSWIGENFVSDIFGGQIQVVICNL